MTQSIKEFISNKMKDPIYFFGSDPRESKSGICLYTIKGEKRDQKILFESDLLDISDLRSYFSSKKIPHLFIPLDNSIFFKPNENTRVIRELVDHDLLNKVGPSKRPTTKPTAKPTS